jgi:type VI secretion system protein ImpG
MSSEALDYYNRELGHLRKQSQRFARMFPKIAGRLQLGPEGSEDPHVERLLQGFAYLSAGVRQQLDDGDEQLASRLISVLSPNCLRPRPSCGLIHLDLDPGQTELVNGLTIPRGQGIDSDAISGEPCRFRTVYNTTLWPIRVSTARWMAAPFAAPPSRRAPTAAAVLKITVTPQSKATLLAKLSLRTLRLYLDGSSAIVARLYETIFRHVQAVGFANSADDTTPVEGAASLLRPVGFELNETLTPLHPQCNMADQLLSDFFTFPQKFHFIDIDIPPAAMARCRQSLDVLIYLRRTQDSLEANVTADTFRLGCTPVVNLFSQRAEPIRVHPGTAEYRVVPDLRRPLSMELFAIERATLTLKNGTEEHLQPLYGLPTVHDDKSTICWTERRVNAADLETRPDAPVDRGTELLVSLVDRSEATHTPEGAILQLETTCLNRDLPRRLPYGGGQPRLQLSQGSAAVSSVRCLLAFTPTQRPALNPELMWRLVSRLGVHHLPISGGENGADVLRRRIELHSIGTKPEEELTIRGIQKIECRRITATTRGALARGLELELLLDPDCYGDAGPFLFASVLDRYLSRSVTLNSFTRLIVATTTEAEEYHRWPNRIGGLPLL